MCRVKISSYWGIADLTWCKVLTKLLKFSLYLQTHTFIGNWVVSKVCFDLLFYFIISIKNRGI